MKRETISAKDIFPEGFYEECLDGDIDEGYVRVPGDAEFMIDTDRFESIASWITGVDGDNYAAWWVLIVRRRSDNMHFKVEYDESHEGGSNIFSQTATQVFPKQVTSIIYE